MPYYKTVLAIAFAGLALMTQNAIGAQKPETEDPVKLRLYVIFNNVSYKPGLETSWGFSCLVEGLEQTILFDTGGNGEILLSNMQQLGLDPDAVEIVVLSHIHGDHTGGLDTFLASNPDVTVYLPQSFPSSFEEEVIGRGATVETVSGPRELIQDAYSTGEMGGSVKEQALIVDTQEGLILITGCAHPHIAKMAERAKDYLGKPIYLLMGGFHLGGRSDAEIRAIIQRLKALGVRKVAPSHCTGEDAARMLRDAWDDDFIEGGLGAVIEVPR